MQNWMKIAAAVGILILAVGIFWLRSGDSPNNLAGASSYDTRVMCRACNQSYPDTLGKGDTYPLSCKKCGKKEAWPQKQCYKCGNRFVPPPEGNPPHMPVAPRCPKCKSDSVGSVPPEE